MESCILDITQFHKQTTLKFIVMFFSFLKMLCDFIVATQNFLFATFLTEINDFGSLKI